jgi:hypothetical protein
MGHAENEAADHWDAAEALAEQWMSRHGHGGDDRLTSLAFGLASLAVHLRDEDRGTVRLGEYGVRIDVAMALAKISRPADQVQWDASARVRLLHLADRFASDGNVQFEANMKEAAALALAFLKAAGPGQGEFFERVLPPRATGGSMDPSNVGEL